jgi:hypothetical protein
MMRLLRHEEGLSSYNPHRDIDAWNVCQGLASAERILKIKLDPFHNAAIIAMATLSGA